MLIYGHRFIPNENFYDIQDIKDIQKTPPSSTVSLDFAKNHLNIINHLRQNHITFALKTKDITEIIYASSLGASYIIVEKSLAKSANDIANNYLFDAKILAYITDENDIQEMAVIGVDGVVFADAFVKAV